MPKRNSSQRAAENRSDVRRSDLAGTRARQPTATGPDGICSHFLSRFRIDLRSLALFRILIALVILLDLAIRAADWSAMYADAGMFPRSLICRHYTSIWNWSFHFGSGSVGFQKLLWVVSAGSATALLFGWQTRTATIGSWLMLVSLHNRVPPVLNGGDNLARMLLFWGMFLPLGEIWSLDCWRSRRHSTIERPRSEVQSGASAGILVQMAVMYMFSAYYKSQPDWWLGKAIAGTLSHDAYAKPLGETLLAFPRLLTGMTVSILILEWMGPILLFSRNTQIRVSLVGILAVMHLGIEMLLWVGLFSWTSIAGLVLFLPRSFWDSRYLLALASPHRVAANAVDEKRTPRVDSPSTVAFHGLGWILTVWVLAINLSGLSDSSFKWLAPVEWDPLLTGAGFGQKWNMFASIPSRDGWFVARAKLVSDVEVDLLRKGVILSWERPQAPAAVYPNHRWRKLFREMAYADELGFQVFRLPAAKYLCRRWNSDRSDAEQVAEFDLVFCTDPRSSDTGGDAEPAIAPARELLVHLE